MCNENGGKVGNHNRIKDRTRRLAVREHHVRKTKKEYFEDLLNIDTEE